VGNEFAGTQAGKLIGHTMIAFRSALTGELKILDRTGKIVTSLAELDAPGSGYSGISNAAFYGRPDTVMLIKNSTIVTVLESGSTPALVLQSAATPLRTSDSSSVLDPRWVWKFIGLEMQSIPFRVECRKRMPIPLRVAPAKGQVQTQTFCMSYANFDNPMAAPTCMTTQAYVVQQGDTLQAIAMTAYGDSERWRGIAAVNSLSNPNLIQPGMTLIIP
jgi:hypothetical protein